MVVVMYLLAILGVAAVVFMLIKKMDIKITLFVVGILLIIAAMIMGKTKFESINDLFYPIQSVVASFKKTLTGAGFIILMLGGYTAYMSHIGANEVTVNTITGPLKKISSPYILVPIVFLIGNVLSLVIPSASNLAIILLATLYPVLKKSGMSSLTAAAVIATTATVMPTPLGGDNISIAAALAEAYGIQLSATDYVFKFHAIVSIPTLLVMAGAHYFWQKWMDRKDVTSGRLVEEQEVELEEVKEIRAGTGYRFFYTILPLLPILILILSFVVNIFLPEAKQLNLSVEIVTILSFIIAVITHLVFNYKLDGGATKTLKGTESFFKGMGSAMGIVALLVAAEVFVSGLKEIGIIEHLQSTMQNSSMPGFVLPLILVVFTAVIVLISGSGTALFYAMVPLMVPLAAAAGISVLAISVPMGLAGNLLRAVSPVSAVVMIVAGTTKLNPVDIVKRTSVPMVTGVVFMFVLSMVLFLSGIVALPL